MSLHNRTALVTGASSGLGVDFAWELARRGAGLVLVARRTPRLEQLAQEVRSQCQVPAQVLNVDLAQAEERERLLEELTRRQLPVDILVNNAGLGMFGDFAAADWPRLENMLQVNLMALTHLTRLVLPGMRERRWGRILQVASTAAFASCPRYAAYAASKAYVLSFSRALHFELRGTGVSCTTLCPGVTDTEFFQVAQQLKLSPFQRATMMKSPQVARIGIRAMLAQRPQVVAGRVNAILAFSGRFFPTELLTAVAARLAT